jgi:hypothetical protein
MAQKSYPIRICIHYHLVGFWTIGKCLYRGAVKSLAWPISRCILFDGKNILFDASLVLYT